MSPRKLYSGLAAYALLALSASVTLEREMLWAVWVLLGGLALKTLIAAKQLGAQHAAQTAKSSRPHKVDPHK